ncbi:exonuclease domain-containing protein [Pacificoceanicola onchidii]|uniref:exonuclease domain-containing protein n=1 Tax=Pacificoceanicola onchidii TaxID=2562685 RepID=UPI0010A38C64|nr:exonuclease domain-containing protein [Pacificoceanicola onchidii]
MQHFPQGSFRFFALDVETANRQRGSICQLGVACVRPDGQIETWSSHVDPQTDDWSCTRIHGITGADVAGAPLFCDVLDLLEETLSDHVIYQHSGFDKSAVAAACREYQRDPPEWDWRDSVLVARKAWPELKRNGGHGLASLKQYLGLSFRHHDAGEDARAAAEVVLRAEAVFSG